MHSPMGINPILVQSGSLNINKPVAPIPSVRKPEEKKRNEYQVEENKLQDINAVQNFFEKYKQNIDKNKNLKETAFTKFINKCESFGIPPRPFGIVQRNGNRQDIDVK